MAEGTPVGDIHGFCASDLPVAKRHKLQEWAKGSHNIHLEIYDGQAISELLAEPDAFWIATKYLGIPSEIYPSSATDKNDRYLRILDSWKGSDREPQNFADFGELKFAIRHATFAESAKSDLPFWIDKMATLKHATIWAPLQRSSTYEIIVASLRGLGTLDEYEDQIREYFSVISDLSAIAPIEDSAVLWTYCAGAHRRGLLRLPVERLREWRDAIICKITEESQIADSPGRRCSLLDIYGYTHMVKSIAEPEGEPDLAGAISTWLEMVAHLEAAPLFPIERFADRLTQFLAQFPIMGDHPSFDSLTQEVDEILAQRHGQFVAASKCRERASALYMNDRIIHAIRQLHHAKVKWFAEESLHSSIFAMLLLSSCYLKLGLTFAAKYYALMAAYTSLESARDDLKKLAPEALTTSAYCDYIQGAWCSFFDLELVALSAFSVFSQENDPSEMNEINSALFHTSLIYRLAEAIEPDILPTIRGYAEKMGLSEELTEIMETARKPWPGKSPDEIWAIFESQIHGCPFSDAGPVREVDFRALGVTWQLQWDNTYRMNAVAEELLSVLQILLAELADIDLCLLRTTVKVKLHPSDDSDISITAIADNDATRWEVGLPAVPRAKGTALELTAEVTGLAVALLHSSSLMPESQLFAVLKRKSQEGLSSRVFSIERYAVIYYRLIDRSIFEDFRREPLRPLGSERKFEPTLHHELKWVCSPGPGYNKERAEVALETRYARCALPIQRTLKRLAESHRLQEIVLELRSEGWLDWHILQAAMNITLNYRMSRAIHFGLSPEEAVKLADQWANEPEKDNAIPIPLEEFSSEEMRRSLRISMLATLKIYNLESHHETPDLTAISDFLGERYGYWSDDVDHPDLGLKPA
ncbi:MAG: hypothetical protein GY854_24940 [Deltaproteobacteria bacterium]|nr:hypothetical protein [Deltaproteobacteria bacterium]